MRTTNLFQSRTPSTLPTTTHTRARHATVSVRLFSACHKHRQSSPPPPTTKIQKTLLSPPPPMANSTASVLSSTSLFCGFTDSRPAITMVGVKTIGGRRFPEGLSKSSFQLGGTRGLTAKPSRMTGVVYATAATEKSLHDFTVKDIDGKDVSLSKFKGKVLLIVNVASRCGLTTSNYSELSHMYEKYMTQGFEILAFPCNQFGGQEPGSNSEIKQFACTRFKAEFPIFNKVDVNGPSTAPVYQFLKSSAGGFFGDLIKWNFEKFLVDKNGKVVERYPPTTSPFQIEKDIKKLVGA